MEKIVRAWRRIDRLKEAEQEQQRHDRRHLGLRKGDVVFHTPRGRLLPDAPALPVISQALTVKQQDSGITSWTATPDWNGERLDLHWTMAVLRQP